MTISLSPQLEKLIEEKVRNGEFPSPEAVVEFALNRMLHVSWKGHSALSADEQVKALDEFFAEVDSDPSPGVDPLPADALRRRTLYDNHRNRS